MYSSARKRSLHKSGGVTTATTTEGCWQVDGEGGWRQSPTTPSSISTATVTYNPPSYSDVLVMYADIYTCRGIPVVLHRHHQG